MGRTLAEERQLIQAAFDHFRCSYAHRDKLFAFAESLGEPHYAISRLTVKYLGREQAKVVRGFYRLPTTVNGQPFVDDPRKYCDHDRQFEAEHKVRFADAREPTSKSLERVLQGRVAEVLDRIEKDLILKKSFFRMRTARGQRREIDLLCEDRDGIPVVIEFKRFGEKPREIVGQVVEYMGMVTARTGLRCRAYIVVDQPWSAIENAPVVIQELRVLRYSHILPELFHNSGTG